MENPSRRSFLGKLVGACGAAVGALMVVPLARFASYPMSLAGRASEWLPLGPPEQFKGPDPIRAEVEIRKRDGWRVSHAKETVWVTRDARGALQVLSAICPHLGCVVPWNADKRQFSCPCHQGGFARDGARLSGPPPRRLDVLPSKIERGLVYVRYRYFRNLGPRSEVIS